MMTTREGDPSFLKRVDVPERGVACRRTCPRPKRYTGSRASMWNAVIEDEPTETVRLVSYDPTVRHECSKQFVFVTPRTHTTRHKSASKR